MTDPGRLENRRRKVLNSRSAAEIIERLSVPIAPGKRATPAWILKQFRTRTRLPTSESERAALCELLERLDPSWEARASVVVRALPELVVESTATVAYQLTVAARAVSSYPAKGTSDSVGIAIWLENLWRHDRSAKPRRMPWLALVALWPDRWTADFAQALGALLAGPIAVRPSKLARPIERLAANLMDPIRGMRTFEEARALIEPYGKLAERIATLDGELAATLKRSTKARLESDDLTAALRSLREELATERSQRGTSDRQNAEALQLAERQQMETEGRAYQQHARLVSTFGPEVRALADDIVLYLDRPDPNVAGALRRAREMLDLGRRLEKET